MKPTIAILALCSLCATTANAETFSSDVWADNWFEMRIDGTQVAQDSVPITIERSFNSESFTFEAEEAWLLKTNAFLRHKTKQSIEDSTTAVKRKRRPSCHCAVADDHALHSAWAFGLVELNVERPLGPLRERLLERAQFCA